jgi:hypothetical protein
MDQPYLFKTNKQKTAAGVMILALVSFSFSARWYYTVEKCRMNDEYIKETKQSAIVMMSMLKHLQEKNAERGWWVDFGSLLALERNYAPMIWDSDTDFSVVVRDQADKEAIEHEMKEFNMKLPKDLQFTKIGLHINNQILQLHTQWSHNDIFFWERHTNLTGYKLMTNFHDPVGHPYERYREEELVLPVQVSVFIMYWCVLFTG